MPTYTYSQLKSDVNGKIKGKIGILTNERSTLNQAAREVFSKIDLKTSRRKATLTPNLFSGPQEHVCPTDLKGYAIITVEPQVLQQRRIDWSLVPYEQFSRRNDNNTIAIGDSDFTRKIYLNTQISDLKTMVSSFDSLSAGGGTWESFGDATSIVTDQDNYVEGNGSLRFDINASGGTTAGVKNTALNTIDLTDFLQGNGTLIVFAYITSVTNLTNYILRLGTNASNYYSKTVTSQSDGTAFQNGWNMLEFDLNSLSETGSVTDTTINYSALYMTKSAGKISELGYRFDYMVLRRGNINRVVYYSKYPWQTTNGVYIENSVNDSDFLNVDTDEYNLVLLKATEYAAEEVDEEFENVRIQRGKIIFNPRYEKFKELKRDYEQTHPSEALVMISTVADFVKV